MSAARLFRYELSADTFQPLDDAGMFVSCTTVKPLVTEVIHDLPKALDECGVELRIVRSLAPLRELWSTSLHASGIRLRNAESWPQP